MLQTAWSLSTGDGQKLEDNTVFVTILLAIIIGWILVTVYQRFVENLLFYTLGLDETSTSDALFVAIVMTVFFVSLINFIDKAGLVGQSPTPANDSSVPDEDKTAQQDVSAAQGALLSDIEHPPGRKRVIEWLGTNQNRKLCPVSFSISKA